MADARSRSVLDAGADDAEARHVALHRGRGRHECRTRSAQHADVGARLHRRAEVNDLATFTEAGHRRHVGHRGPLLGRDGRTCKHLAPRRDGAVGLLAYARGRAAIYVLVDVLDPHPLLRRRILDGDLHERHGPQRVLLHVTAAPVEIGEIGLRARMPFLGQHRQVVHPELDLLGACIRAELHLRELELGVLVVVDGRRVLQVIVRTLDVGLEPDHGQPRAQIAGESDQRLRHERRAPSVVGIDVASRHHHLLEQLIGEAVVGRRPGVVGIDAGKVKAREELVALRPGIEHLVQTANGEVVSPFLVGFDPPIERRLRL